MLPPNDTPPCELLTKQGNQLRQIGRCRARRIDEFEPKLNAFITVLTGRARERALELDSELARGIDRGPLHGIPIAVKDLIHMKDVATTAGSRLFGANALADAQVISRLEDAGAVVVGKTGLHELAYGITSNNPHFGAVRNPHDTSRIPGGSSGGSGAAVAAGIVPMALGTDTGGSIRIPAAFCGCVGLKPTYGRVSKRGVLPLGFTLDHVGPLSATVADSAITLNAIAGYDAGDPTTSSRPVEEYQPVADQSLRGVRIGRPRDFYFDRLSAEVSECVERSFELATELGATVVPVTLPDVNLWNSAARVILLAEASAAYESHMERRDQMGADVLGLLDQGRLIPATMYVQAQRLRSQIITDVRQIWAGVDCLFTPVTPTTAPEIGARSIEVAGVDEDVRLASTRLVRGINLLGLPALSLPCGVDASSLPIGLQIIGPPFSERRLLQIGSLMENALPPSKLKF